MAVFTGDGIGNWVGGNCEGVNWVEWKGCTCETGSGPDLPFGHWLLFALDMLALQINNVV